MDIIVIRPIATMGEEKAIVSPGEYKLVLVYIVKEGRDLFFFLGLEGICVGVTMLCIMEKIGLIKIKKQ